MTKNKYEIKNIFEEGCTETYILKNGKKFRRIPKDGLGYVYSLMAIIELLIKELNNN